MSPRTRVVALLLAAAPVTAALAQPLTPAELGRREFESNCATCHGIDARGGGPMKPFLAREPADLTTMARRRGGSFPASQLADLIDGRGIAQPGSHGSREMPVWGRVYREQTEAQGGSPLPPEWTVRGRILALVKYLESLQQP